MNNYELNNQITNKGNSNNIDSKNNINKESSGPSKEKYMILIVIIIVFLLVVCGIVFLRSVYLDSQTINTQTDTAMINIDNSDDEIDWDSLPTTNVVLSKGVALEITEAGTYVLSGETDNGVIVNSEGNVRLALDGVIISNNNLPAIYVEDANNAIIQTINGSNNTINDSSARADEELNGVIYSKDDLFLSGNGTLNVKSNYEDAIVSKDDLKISSGNYVISSVDDGIRGTDSISITGGTVVVDSDSHAIKSTNETDVEKGFIYISGGDITIDTRKDGINATNKVIIDGGIININTSAEGIEAALITINDGNITINATDDGINASESTMITHCVLTINGGNLSVSVAAGDTDALDSNGDLIINGGTITLNAQTSSIDYEYAGELNGGTVIVNGQQITSMPNPMGGGMGTPGGNGRTITR